jgi:hypothetical protein
MYLTTVSPRRKKQSCATSSVMELPGSVLKRKIIPPAEVTVHLHCISSAVRHIRVFHYVIYLSANEIIHSSLDELSLESDA